jgi:formylglycine-generating enzyme required for sulfatase activity
LISSRFSGITPAIELKLDRWLLSIDVQALGQEQIASLVHKWFRAVKAGEPDENQAEGKASRLIEYIRKLEYEDGELRTLVGSPLLLTLLCSVARVDDDEVPRERATFYRRCLEILLQRRSKDPGVDPPSSERLALRMLRIAAHQLHEKGRRDGLSVEIFREWTRPALATVRSTTPIDTGDVLRWLHEQAGILTKFGDDDYGFAHLTFQEYLTAVHVENEGDEELMRLADRFGEPWWQEVVLLCLASENRRIFDVFMHRLLAGQRWLSEQPVRSDDPDPRIKRRTDAPWRLLERCWDIAVARTVAPFMSILREPRSEVVAGVRWKLLGMFQGEIDEELLTWAAAVARDGAQDAVLRDGARALVEEGVRLASQRGVVLDSSLFGITSRTTNIVNEEEHGRFDPLKGMAAFRAERVSSSDRWTEPITGITFLSVPGGDFVMGSQSGELGVDDAEMPAHRVTLNPFMFAETPVTNAQYGLFMKENPNALEPEYWRDRRFSGSDQPVVGVSWHEASAFCAWLTTLVRQTHRDLEARLPTEAQWERAARGDDRRPYPWGADEPTEAHACFGQDNKSGQPAPVGRYPHGRGPYGHLDLAGNVWEWCQDTWDRRSYLRWVVWSTIDSVVEDADTSGRVRRGGAWSDRSKSLRAACRGLDQAEVRFIYLGFRVCCVSSNHRPPNRLPAVPSYSHPPSSDAPLE